MAFVCVRRGRAGSALSLARSGSVPSRFLSQLRYWAQTQNQTEIFPWKTKWAVLGSGPELTELK